MVAGGQGARPIVSRYAAYITRAGSSACTGHVARGIAGGENAAGSVKSHHAASEGVDCGGSFKGHVSCGIAGCQGGTIIRFTCHAA